jgi:hypothetical protein
MSKRRTSGLVLLLCGMSRGPYDIVYVNPEDDPGRHSGETGRDARE